VTGLVCHPRPRKLPSANLTPASGRQDHTTSPSADIAPSSEAPSASTASRPASVTIASRPSVGRDGRACRDDLPDGESKIFFAKGLDSQFTSIADFTDLPVRQTGIVVIARSKSDEAIHSSRNVLRILRGACHRARVRATRWLIRATPARVRSTLFYGFNPAASRISLMIINRCLGSTGDGVKPKCW
jgi:hypothetical protein